MIHNQLFTISTVLFLTFSATFATANITIATNGQSNYKIVIPAKSPQSLRWAVEEFQRDIKLSTCANLGIKRDNQPVNGKFISLGYTKQAKAEGFSIKGMAEGSYRIVVKNGNLFIFGPDTPDSKWTKHGGTSTGTANGVYTFLEKQLGVRWLMPGKIGRSVPKHDNFTLDSLDIHGNSPIFAYRHIGHLWDGSTKRQRHAIQRWEAHLRVGIPNSSRKISMSHNWWRTLNGSANPDAAARGSHNVNTKAIKNIYKKHPDWFAMNSNGKRPYPKNYHSKLETTNPKFIHWYAKQAIRKLKASKRPPVGFSLSPSDGGGWSKSLDSKALYDPPQDKFNPSEKRPGMSSLVLKWYHDVAQIVEKKYPQGRLYGFLYGQYLYPPVKIDMKLPDNFTPVIAGPGGYGSHLYLENRRKRFLYIINAWSDIASSWYYYGEPAYYKFRYDTPDIGKHNLPTTTANVVPGAPGVLKFVFSNLVRTKCKGVYLYGDSSWSDAALRNYLLAKLSWNPKLNPYQVEHDWLTSAYGDEVGIVMQHFYKKLNSWLNNYAHKGYAGTKLKLRVFKDVYADHYGELEKLYLKAKSKSMTNKEAKRLQLIGDNLIVLQWRLRNAGFLPINYKSELQRTDEQINKIMAENNLGFPMFPGAIQPVKGWKNPSWQVRMINERSRIKGKAPKLDSSTFIIYTAGDRQVSVIPQTIHRGAYFAPYILKDENCKTIKDGILIPNIPITFMAQKNHAYYFYIPSRKSVHYMLKIPHASAVNGILNDGALTLYRSTNAPIQVYNAPSKSYVGLISNEGGALEIVRPLIGAKYKDREIRTGRYQHVQIINSISKARFHLDPHNNLDKSGVTKLDFNDHSWKTINTTDWWQFQGFPNYHGTAWYRIKFTIPKVEKREDIRVYFGSIDGNAVAYINGHKLCVHNIGPPPKFKGWNLFFSTSLHRSDINIHGQNILAVKVTSKSKDTASGITGGIAIVGRIKK